MLIWKPQQFGQTSALRKAGLTVDDLRNAGFKWTRNQQWEAPDSPDARRLVMRLGERIQDAQERDTDEPETVKITNPSRPPALAVVPATAKAAALAERMYADAEAKRGSRLTNTPKRLAQANSARLEADRLKRAAKLLDAWSKDPSYAPEWKPSKAEALAITRKKTVMHPNGYHAYDVETDEWGALDNAEHEKIRAAYCVERLLTPEQEKQRNIDLMVENLRFAKIPGFFPTPSRRIKTMLLRADIRPGQKILEPSAGKGDIADAIRNITGEPVDVCELCPSLAMVLKLKQHTFKEPNFSDLRDAILERGDPHYYKYDRIIANPPFEEGRDALHIRWMYDVLKPGGRIVTLCSSGPFFRQYRVCEEFRRFLVEVNADIEDLDDDEFTGTDAFRETRVKIKQIIIDKPLS